MQFKLSKSYRYWWPVVVRLPHPDKAGEIIEAKFEAQFEPLPRDDLMAAQEAAAKLTTLRELMEHEARQATLMVKSWRGVLDESGADLPFSSERLEGALQLPWIRAGINEALTQSMNGEAARLGN